MLSALKRTIAKLRPDGRLTTFRDRYRIAAAMSLVPQPLPKILTLFGSDKQRPGQHSYGRTYQELLRPWRFKRAKILEIGLLGGDSVLAWRAFFPFATVVGIDIEDKSHMAGDNTRIYTADQGSASDLDALVAKEGPFDVIIDDGSHFSHHQLFSFHHLFPHLRDGGIYIVEDVQTSFWTGTSVMGKWDGAHIADDGFAATCYGYFLELAKYLNHPEFETLARTDSALLGLGRQIVRIAFEHNLIIIWKGSNDLPSNAVRRDGE